MKIMLTMKKYISFLSLIILFTFSSESICKSASITSDNKWIIYQTNRDDYLNIDNIGTECHLLINDGDIKIDIGTRPNREYSHSWNFTIFSKKIPDKSGKILDISFDGNFEENKNALNKMHFAGIQRNNIIRFSGTDNQINLIVNEINKNKRLSLNVDGYQLNIKNINTITSFDKKQFSRCLSNNMNVKNWFNED